MPGVHVRGHTWQGVCVQERRLLKQAVRILLESILVSQDLVKICIKMKEIELRRGTSDPTATP